MKAIYTIAADFPHGTPYASRTLNFCRILKSLGYEVVVFCDYLSDKEYRIRNGLAIFEGIEIHYSFENRSFKSKLTAMYVTPNKLEKYIKQNDICFVISSQTSNRFLRIMHKCKKLDVKMIVELCEKFHFSNWKLGKFDYQYYQFLYCWKFAYKKADGFIVISSYLYNLFKKYNKPIIQIPTILDTYELESIYQHRKVPDEMNEFIFTGGLGGGKDRLAEWIIATKAFKDDTIITHVFGPTKEAVEQQLNEYKESVELPSNIHFHGRIPQKEVPYQIAKNDFGLILRPDRESSHAGFPTKIAEYLASGTAVITNKTSDIPKYITDGFNGFIIEDLNIDEVNRVIIKVLNMTNSEKTTIAGNARRTAIKYFDYRRYINLLRDFIGEFI